MYNKLFGTLTTTGIRGTHHSPGSDYVYYVQQGSNNSILGRIRITPLELVSKGNADVTLNTQLNLDDGSTDLRWVASGETRALQAMGATRLYKYSPAPTGGLANIDPTTLPTLPFTALGFTDDGQGDNYYAVKLASSNFAVIRFFLDSTSTPAKTRVEWFTYKLNFNPTQWALFDCFDPRDIVMSPDEQTAYISGDDHVYRIPNQSLTGSLDFNTSVSTWAIDIQPLNEPQQMALYNQMLYVVAGDSLWVIDPVSNTQRAIVSGLGMGVGLLIDAAQEIAYVSNQAGALFSVDLGNPAPVLLPLPGSMSPLPGPGGFLTWADDTRSAFYVTVPNPANEVIRVDLNGRSRAAVLDATGCPADPWSVEVISGGRLFLASNGELGDISLGLTSTELLMGIGHVPFQFINNPSMDPLPAPEDMGKADTARVPGYFFQVHNAPFGGSLTLMINHRQAMTVGIKFYRVTLIGPSGAARVITKAFTDLKWVSTGGTPQWELMTTSSTGATGTPANAFVVRDLDELWYHPYIGAIIDTTAADNDLNTIQVEYFDENGVLLPVHTVSKQVLIDNDTTGGSLFLPRLGTTTVAPEQGAYPDLDCGCIRYASKDDLVEVDFSAWHPKRTGRYALSFYRGGTHLDSLYEAGTVDSQELRTKFSTSQDGNPPMRVGHILGSCNVANVSIHLSVPASSINGFGWLNYGTYLSKSFTLLPDSINMSTPWP